MQCRLFTKFLSILASIINILLIFLNKTYFCKNHKELIVSRVSLIVSKLIQIAAIDL